MAKPEGVRVLRVSRQLLEVLARYIQNRPDWDVQDGYISLTRIRMTKDLKNAKVGVRLMRWGDTVTDEQTKLGHQKAVEALKTRIHDMQKTVAHELKLRFTPKLQFVVDESWDEVLKVENTLRDLGLGDTESTHEDQQD